MRRFILLTLLGAALLGTLFLTACGGQVTTEPTATPEPPTPTPEPEQAYFGIFYGQSASSLTFYERLGKNPALSAIYVGWGDRVLPTLPNTNAMLGRITFITWEFSVTENPEYLNNPLEAIPDGLYDDYLITWAEDMAKIGKPVMLRWGHEMNGNWYRWGGANNGGATLDGFGAPETPDGPERFIAAYRHIHDVMLAHGANNVIWVWCPMGPFASMDNAYAGATDWNHPENYYPGDEYVDWLCLDVYNWGTSSFGQQFNSRWETFEELTADSYNRLLAIAPDKPIIIGEYASTEDGGDKAVWVADMFTDLKTRFPRIEAIIWFHILKETDWRMNSSDEVFAVFQQELADDYWLDEWPGMKDE